MPRVPKLHAGDRVRLIAPGGQPAPELVEHLANVLTGWGLVPEVGTHVLDRYGYLAGTDDDRLADLNEALRDPGVRAVIAVPGSRGVFRIADRADFAALEQDPKPVVGVGQITYLQLAAWRECRVAGVYGAVTAVREALMTDDCFTLRSDPAGVTTELSAGDDVSGVLLGGSLSVLSYLVGAGLPSLDGVLLFLDETRTVGLGTVDRAVTQLLRSGMLDGVRGVVLGQFTGFAGYVDRGWTVADVLRDRLGQLGVPVLGGLPLGEGPGALAVPLGVAATISPTASKLTVDDCW